MPRERKRELEKLKIKGGEILIKYHETGGEGRYPETHTVEGTEPPLEALKSCLQRMAVHAIGIMEAPEHWEDEMTVLGVSINHDDELSLVISSTRELELQDAPLVLNTPNTIPGPACLETLRRLEALAMDYVDGERAQRVLDFETQVTDINGVDELMEHAGRF